MSGPRRDRYGNDLTVWVLWLWLPGRIGWVSQRQPYSSREAVVSRAEERRKFLAGCGLDVRAEVRDEEDGPPPSNPDGQPNVS